MCSNCVSTAVNFQGRVHGKALEECNIKISLWLFLWPTKESFIPWRCSSSHCNTTPLFNKHTPKWNVFCCSLHDRRFVLNLGMCLVRIIFAFLSMQLIVSVSITIPLLQFLHCLLLNFCIELLIHLRIILMNAPKAS